LAEQLIEGTIIKPEDFTDQPIANVIINEETIEGDVSVIEVNEEGELIIKKEEDSDNSVEENNPE
jgi:segregation and condensation protein B